MLDLDQYDRGLRRSLRRISLISAGVGVAVAIAGVAGLQFTPGALSWLGLIPLSFLTAWSARVTGRALLRREDRRLLAAQGEV